MNFTLRPLQAKAIAELRALVVDGKRRILLVAPCAFGKTVVIVAIARGHLGNDPGNRVLVVVHRRELVRQTVAKLVASGLGPTEIGVLDANNDCDVQRVVVASLQTLVARGRRPAATLVVWDEAHHCPAASFQTVRGAYPESIHIGVTATPIRADQKPLGDMFEAMVVGATVRELTEIGLLVPSEVLVYRNEPTKALAMHPVDAYRTHTPGRAAVVFCASVAHARKLADEFVTVGVRAACIDGKTNAKTRDASLAAFDAGTLDVITNCFVLTEGWSCDRADVCILARAPEHAGTYLQMVGRVLRTMAGKRIATVLDLRGCSLSLGLPDEDRRWQLEGAAVVRTEVMVALRRCTECLAVFRPARTCPRCGAEHQVVEKIPRVLRRAEKLERLNDVPQAKRDALYVGRLVTIARTRMRMSDDAAKRWAVSRFEKQFRRKPVAA